MKEDNKLIDIIIKDYISIIFSYALKRTNSREDAEDLAQDILSELVLSVDKIKNPKAYNGFIWAIANNTYKRWLNKRNKNKSEYLDDYLGLEIFKEDESERIEDKIVHNEELNRLRWELSLLSKTYRDIVILYYIDGKSCGEIAEKFNFTTDNVKYFLYKARNMMRGGINMNRELGEKSYKPAEFSINYWGDHSVNYYNLSKRKLPGNILLTAIEKPISISEISIETGVPVAYLEDEISILEEEGFLSNVKGDRYQTSLVVINKKVSEAIDGVLIKYAKGFSEKLYENLVLSKDKVKKVCSLEDGKSVESLCHINDGEMEEKYLWEMVPLLLSVPITDSIHPENLLKLPILERGNHGWIWGSEESNKPWDWSVKVLATTKQAGFGGKYAMLIDFNILRTKNKELIGPEEIELLSKMYIEGSHMTSLNEREKEIAARMIENNYGDNVNGLFKFRGSIFNYGQGEEGKKSLEEIFNLYEEYINKANLEVEKILIGCQPKHLHEQSKYISYVKTISGLMSAVMEEMVHRGYIHVPVSENMYPIGCYIRV